MIGVGGEHASTLAAFLDLPESHKWPRHFATLEKFTHSEIEMIKIKSQEMCTKNEVNQAIQEDGERAHSPIPRITASFDMGWQVRSSGGKYGSCTGHAMLIGAHSRKIMDSIVFNKRCNICNKHEQRRIETGQLVKQHRCMKNYDGTSKSMEAAALVAMLCRMPQEKGVSIKAIISDDDSNGRKKAQHMDRGGQLPPHVEEPKFLADPSHRKRVFARSIYNLANASRKVSKVTKGLASHIKYCYGACIKRYWLLPADEMSAKVWNVLEHISGKHEGCCESFCYDKKAQKLNVPYTPPVDHRICPESDGKTYNQLKEIFGQYASVEQMSYCNHPYDTQTNEVINQAIANVAPKSVCYSGTVSLMSRVALVVGMHTMGHIDFFRSLFNHLGIPIAVELFKYLERKGKRKEWKRTYQKQLEVKVSRSKAQKKQRQEVFAERTDKSYGPGVGLNAGIRGKRKRDTGTDGSCKCGSILHKRTTHKDCPLNKKKRSVTGDIQATTAEDQICVPINSRHETPNVIIPIETEVALENSTNKTPLLGWNTMTSADHQVTYDSDTSDEGSEDDERDMLVSRIADAICLQGNEYEYK